MEAVPSVGRAEHLVKHFSVFTQAADPDAMCAVAMLAMPISELRQFVVRDSLTLALDVGTAVHEAIAADGDPAQAAATAAGDGGCSRAPVSSATGRTRAAT